ncbi:MAG: metallophosphoesterase family protein [Acidobacteriota bacterium]
MAENRDDARRIFAVGDVHGCFDRLVKLMKRLDIDPKRDFLIFLGDYINRGPQSREVVSYLLELGESFPNAVFLRGNHEHELLEYARTGDVERLRHLRKMGVEETLKSYDNSPMASLRDLSFMPADHRRFIERLRAYFELDGHLFVHAGVAPGEDVERCSIETLLNVRDPFLECRKTMESRIVFGHTPFETPLVTPDKIGIDTGAAYGNLLTAVELPRLRFYHA